MKNMPPYPLYISSFGNRWVLHRRKFGGVITTTHSEGEAIEQGEKTARKLAFMFGEVPLYMENGDGNYHRLKTVINSQALKKNAEALAAQ